MEHRAACSAENKPPQVYLSQLLKDRVELNQ